MGNLIQNMLAEDSAEILADIGHSCSWKGASYDCFVGELDLEVDLNEGALMPEGSFTIKIPRADFNSGAGPFPQENDRLSYDSKTYKITSSHNKDGSAYIRLIVSP